MRALFRYVFLKSSRDRSLLSFTIAPGVMIAAPMLGIAVVDMFRGRGRYPLTLDVRTTVESTALGMTITAAVMAIIMAGIAGFWLFRVEISNHSIGTVVIAIRARVITLVAALHAAIIGITAFLLGLMVVMLMTAHIPAQTPRLLLAVICATTATGAAGILVATISAESAMILPLLAASVMIAAWSVQMKPADAVFSALIASFLFVVTAGALMERRCAA
jgi:hypothetical protein